MIFPTPPKQIMEHQNESSRTIVVRFPGLVVRELNELCRENAMGKTEFIQVSIRQLVEYIENYATHDMQLKMQHAERERQRREQEKARAAALAASNASICQDSLHPFGYEGQEEEGELPGAAEEDPPPYTRGSDSP